MIVFETVAVGSPGMGLDEPDELLFELLDEVLELDVELLFELLDELDEVLELDDELEDDEGASPPQAVSTTAARVSVASAKHVDRRVDFRNFIMIAPFL